MHTKSLSDYLQHADLDFVSALDLQKSLISAMKDKRTDASFDAFIIKAESINVMTPIINFLLLEYVHELMVLHILSININHQKMNTE